ncbi:lanthionine synthetase LanC family protein [Actinoplanes sp. NPDC051513]|uniref:lanthionine synthetase LanC family protein n=1 Tax=Actinoplanes sp. NPDC051513 TaxID=3363908 RepID=UPI00379E6F31
MARQAFEWIESVGVPGDDGGSAWLEGGEVVDFLYSGAAGVLLGCAEARAAGLDVDALAGRARDRLIGLSLADDGLFDGQAGIVVALRAWGDDAAAPAAAGLAERILRRDADPARCTDIISGDAGILLALLDPLQPEAVATLADGLVALADDRPDGLHWWMRPDYPNLMPGFSHGTAGVAYAILRAGIALGRTDLVDVAVRAADGLLALGHHPDGWAVPLLIPPEPGRPAVNFGWCHGPTGTLRLFGLLEQVDPHPRWFSGAQACLGALGAARLPARLHPGYWDNVARCCGTAGVGQVLLDRYQATGDPALLAFSRRLADDVLARTVTMPHGVAWSNTEHTATPPDLPPEPGFMQGAAGIAGWLARLDAPGTPAAVPWC